MADPITPTELAAASGISLPYASQILGKKRTPSRPLALAIFRATGRRFGELAGLSDDDIATLDRIERSQQPAQTSAEAKAA